MKDRQRKAMFARINAFKRMGFSPIGAKYFAERGLTPSAAKRMDFKALQKQGIYVRYEGDDDHDGVKNVNDCKPLNPKKQGFIHDVKMKVLKVQEERAEAKREAQQKKINDLKDELALKRKVSSTETSVRQAELDAKKKLMEQKRDEEHKKDALDREEKQIKNEMEKYSWQGKTKAEIKRRWNSKEGQANRAKAKKAFKKLWKQIK